MDRRIFNVIRYFYCAFFVIIINAIGYVYAAADIPVATIRAQDTSSAIRMTIVLRPAINVDTGEHGYVIAFNNNKEPTIQEKPNSREECISDIIRVWGSWKTFRWLANNRPPIKD